MQNMISIPESRFIELIKIEQKYKAGDFNNYELYALYAELKSLINAGLSISNDINNPGNDSIWRRIYDKVFGLDSSICSRWRELVPDFTWYDPDGSCYDDIMTFYQAVKDYAVQNGILFKAEC